MMPEAYVNTIHIMDATRYIRCGMMVGYINAFPCQFVDYYRKMNATTPTHVFYTSLYIIPTLCTAFELHKATFEHVKVF